MAPEDEATAATEVAGLVERPGPDKLSRAVARSRIACALFAKHEPVKLGRYHLLEQVGAGGMGIVWGAWDPELDRRVAIKLVRTELASARERIVREGQALAKLSHPNVVPIYDVGVVDEQVYLVMEWVRGENLRAWAIKPRSDREIAAVYRAAAHGLAAAHAAGLVHRDFKPDNAMVGDDGRVRVLDFGLARGHAEASDGARAGTPMYMAPEQAEGEAVPASDQFAVGVSLREALGKAPPRWLAEIIARATATDPAQRFASMGDLETALGRDPARVWRRRLVAVGVVGVAGAAFAIGTLRAGDAVERCSGGVAEIAKVWNAGVGAGIAAHLRGLGPYGTEISKTIEGELDRYATRWASAYREACQSHDRGELTSPIYAANLGCLERARVALATVSEVLVTASPVRLPDALVAARALPMADRCRSDTETSSVAPPPEAIAGRVAEVGGQVERARMLALAVDPRAIETAAKAARDAEELNYPALVGRAALVHGFALLMQQKRVEAIVAFDRATTAALEARDGTTAVEAIARKLFARATRVDATSAGIAAETQATVALAEPLALGLRPSGGFPRALLFNNAGTVALARQDTTAARAWFEKALGERPTGTADGVELASIVGNLALVEPDHAKRDELFDREGDELATALGADHPLTLDARIRAAMFVEHPGHARELLRDACGRYRRLHPHLVERAAQCAYELVWFAEEHGDVAEANAALATIGPQQVEARVAEGYRLLLAGEVAAASRAMNALADELVPQEHFWRRWRGVDALLVVAIAQHRLGDLATERTTLERALVILGGIDGLKATTFYQRRLARFHLMLARIGANPGEHARAAIEWYRAAGGYDEFVKELEPLTY